MTRVLISADAAADLDDIWFHIAKDSAETADRLLDRIHETAEITLASHPYAGRARDELGEGLRSFAAGRYIIFYKLLDGGIAVVRVLHGARDLPAVFDTRE